LLLLFFWNNVCSNAISKQNADSSVLNFSGAPPGSEKSGKIFFFDLF
jgi:hypothetical protein